MSKFLFVCSLLVGLFMIACTKQPDVAKPTEHNIQRQEEVDQRDLMPDRMKYRETRDLPDGEQVYEEDIEVEER